MPHPLSWICKSFNPPSLIVTRIEVEPASRQFSMSSFRAEEGLWMIYSGTELQAGRAFVGSTLPLLLQSC